MGRWYGGNVGGMSGYGGSIGGVRGYGGSIRVVRGYEGIGTGMRRES